MRQYSAWALSVIDVTRIPAFRSLTSGATASITPAASIPGVSGSLGLIMYSPRMKKVSAKLIPAAWTLSSAVPGASSGFGVSTYLSTLGSPVFSKTIAFTWCALLRIVYRLIPLEQIRFHLATAIPIQAYEFIFRVRGYDTVRRMRPLICGQLTSSAGERAHQRESDDTGEDDGTGDA